MSDYNDLVKWVKNAGPVGRYLEVAKANGPIYHVSHNKKLNVFRPMIGYRQQFDEDRTIPRICCAPTLLGCFKGHMGIETQFHQTHGKEKEGSAFDSTYHGGWKVYAFHPEAYLVPEEELVRDAYKSGEVWLTAYNASTHLYKGVVEATCFYQYITYVARSGSNPMPYGMLVMEVTGDYLQFSPRIRLSKGHYQILGPTQQAIRDFKDDGQYQVKQISESEYLKIKHGSADMLGYQESPVFLGWGKQ